jgi:uncharacterized protein (DUF2249 family)
MTESSKALDIRLVPPPQRHAKIFGVFDSLPPGTSFVLINDHNPKPLLYQFQVEHAGQFDWSVLEAGPDRFRIEIRRRARPGPRNVTDCLGADHQRLDAIFSGVREMITAQEFPGATLKFAEFVCGLTRHIAAEEEILFPLFESRIPMTKGPTSVMRDEHKHIQRGMDSVLNALCNRDEASSGTTLAALGAILSMHNQKEEQILYPMIDDMAGDEHGRHDLVRRIQAL